MVCVSAEYFGRDPYGYLSPLAARVPVLRVLGLAGHLSVSYLREFALRKVGAAEFVEETVFWHVSIFLAATDREVKVELCGIRSLHIETPTGDR